jgi:hypothetical protein
MLNENFFLFNHEGRVVNMALEASLQVVFMEYDAAESGWIPDGREIVSGADATSSEIESFGGLLTALYTNLLSFNC